MDGIGFSPPPPPGVGAGRGHAAHCETRGKYASKESHAFEAYCDVHLALKASPCLAISGNNRLSL